MESMLKSLGASRYSKAAPSSVVKLRELELKCSAALDDDDTVSISTDDGDCFGAFLDMIQVFSLEITVADDVDDAVTVPQPPLALAGLRSDQLPELTAESPFVQQQRSPRKPFFDQGRGTSTKNATMPSILGSGSNIESEALPEYSKAEALPEFSRRLHNDRGQRLRRQRQKWRIAKAETLRELQHTLQGSDCSQRDRRIQGQLSIAEIVVANDLNTKAVCTKAPKDETFIVAE